MNKKSKEFFFKGKYFDSFDEMLDYAGEWGRMKLTHKAAEQRLKEVARDIMINVKASGIVMDNFIFDHVCDDMLFFAMKRFVELAEAGNNADKP